MDKLIKSSLLLIALCGIFLITQGVREEMTVIKVGVIDSGINPFHPIFKDRTIYSRSLSYVYTESLDFNSHGSHVAGIVAQNTPKEIEIHSLKNIYDIDEPSIYLKASSQKDDNSIEHIKLMSVQDHNAFIENFNDFDSSIDYAIKNKVKILNISEVINVGLSDLGISRLKNIFKKAQDHGILVIVSSGNTMRNLNIINRAEISYPCGLKLDNIICVGNITDDMRIVSDYGNLIVDVWAKGVNVLSASKDSTYINMSGSSMAAPKISALAAKIWNNNKLKDYKEIKNILYSKLRKDNFLAQYSTTGLFLN